jgi:hypothetical protein
MRWKNALLVAAALLVTQAAHASGEHPWLALYGVGGTYGMSDLNSEIDAFNTANAGSGVSFPHVDNGMSLGGAVGFESASQWNFGFGMDRLEAHTKAGDATGSLEYRLGANAWRAFGEYALAPVGRSGIYLGGSVGFVQEKGHIIVSTQGYEPLKGGTSGSAPLFEGYAGGNWWLSSRFAVTATAGYRYARLKEFKVEDQTFLMSNGEAMSLNFSGPTVRIGLKLASTIISD